MMSEREKLENARRKGRRAAQDGYSLNDNPMRAMDSRYAWMEAYKAEKIILDRIIKRINSPRVK